MINELIVFSGNTSYNIDLYDNETIDLTKSITDIIDPEQRRSDYTRTIKVPGSANNNKVFSFIFDLSRFTINTTQTQFNPDFNASVKTSAILYRNGIVQIKGFLELTNIVKKPDGSHDYEIVMYGEVADLFKDMGEKKLTDLDLSEFDHVLNMTNIDTLTNGPTQGYVYPIIDNGLSINFENGYYINALSPGIFLRTLVDKIAAAYGYTIDSNFFTSNLFNKLILWCGDNWQQFLTKQEVDDRTFLANRTTNSTYIPIQTTAGTVVLPNAVKQPTTGTGYNTTTGLFDIPVNGFYRFRFNGEVYIQSNIINGDVDVQMKMWKFDGTTYTQLASTSVRLNIMAGNFKDWPVDFEMPANQYFTTNEKVYVEIVTPFNPGLAYYDWRFNTTNVPIQFFNIPSAEKSEGSNISLNKFLPQEMTQVEFMTNLKNMFNLYFEPDPVIPKKLRIEPRDDYYTNTVVDLTSKVDMSKDIVINPLELAKYKTYIFQYDKDDDEYNARYNATSKYTYGYIKFDINNQFLKEQKEIKVTFAPTPLSNTPGWHERVYSKVRWKNNNTFTQKTAKARILYTQSLPTSPNIPQTVNIYPNNPATTQKVFFPNYQYAGHLDDPNASTFDLSFGNPEVVYYEPSGYTQNNLFNKYWRKNILEITDPDSKVVEVSLKLNEYEVKDLTFDKMYLIDRLYYRLIEVNYNVAGYDTVQCKFFQSLNYPNWVDLPSNPTNGGSEIFYGDDGKVIGEAPVYGGTEARGDNGFVENSNNTTYGQNNKMGSQTDNTIINSQGNNYAGEYINVLGGGNNQVYASNVNLLNCSGYISSIEGEQVINNIQQPFYAASAFTRYDVSGIGTTPVCVIPKYEGYFIEVTGFYGQVTFGVGDSTGYSSEKVKIKYGPTGVTIGEIATGLSTATTDKRYTGTLFADIASEEEAVFITSGSEGLVGGNGNIKIEVYYRLIKK
jgi:hypothetical protein